MDKQGFHWIERTGIGLRIRYLLVRDSDSEIVVEITNYDCGEWTVFYRGAWHGTYTSLEAAKVRAEKSAFGSPEDAR